MQIQIERRCQDYGRPGCLEAIDEKYTMSFEDIGEGLIYWCSHCGPLAHEMHKQLAIFLGADPENAEKLSNELYKAEQDNAQKQN